MLWRILGWRHKQETDIDRSFICSQLCALSLCVCYSPYSLITGAGLCIHHSQDIKQLQISCVIFASHPDSLLSLFSTFPSPRPFATTPLSSISKKLVTSKMSYKWIHTVCNLLDKLFCFEFPGDPAKFLCVSIVNSSC